VDTKVVMVVVERYWRRMFGIGLRLMRRWHGMALWRACLRCVVVFSYDTMLFCIGWRFWQMGVMIETKLVRVGVGGSLGCEADSAYALLRVGGVEIDEWNYCFHRT
jgi:hypothetical protein